MMIEKINIIKYGKKFLKLNVNDENGELKIHEKIRLFDKIITDKIIKISSITIVIKSLIE